MQKRAEQASHQIVVRNFRRHRETGVQRSAHGQLFEIAVQDIGALGADFDDALLLAFRARKIVAVAHELQICKTRSSGGRPQSKHYGHNQQTDLRAAEIHSRSGSLHPFNQISTDVAGGRFAAACESLGDRPRVHRAWNVPEGRTWATTGSAGPSSGATWPGIGIVSLSCRLAISSIREGARKPAISSFNCWFSSEAWERSDLSDSTRYRSCKYSKCCQA